ncbi:Haloalkane dehalogenase [Pseudodesulfovibrio hydrargyri]|uniref:Haloalkane dehalogenase n=1 Tax=Pseudodesulfovibrio hydrargyri TaxID=2125990 RepID=A0A1J5N0T0_9BACT|nr:alpha/beta hydrolase [Pseudodesulfovibrio hydrargyri]OIQ52246.1 Haloalkane dehalogenase [Pseudodesulfovibrio hydrargyri]
MSDTDWNLRQTFTFQGREVACDVMGRGEPLVLVHGTPWSSFNLRHLARGLADSFRVHLFDLLGYGQSDKSDNDVSLGVQNRLLTALIGFWGLENPFVVGHDFGGTTVLRAHLLDKTDFRKIALIDPVAVSPWGSPFFRHVREHEAAFAGLPDYIHEAVVRAYVGSAAFSPLPEETLACIVAPWAGARGRAAFYRQMAQADSRYTDEVQDLYPSIQRPVLILWGREDTWIPPEKGRLLNRMIPGSTLVELPGTGHLVIEEQPDALVREIKTFFHH